MGDSPLMSKLLDWAGVQTATCTTWQCKNCTLSNSLTFVQCDACAQVNDPLQSLFELFHWPIRMRSLTLKSTLTNAVYDNLYTKCSEECEFGGIVETATGFQWKTNSWKCKSCSNFNRSNRVCCLQCKRRNTCLEQLSELCGLPYIQSAETVEEDEVPESIDNYIMEKLNLHRDFLTWTCPQCSTHNPADYVQCASCLGVNEPLQKFNRALKAHCKKVEVRFYERWLRSTDEVDVQVTQKPMLLEFLERHTALEDHHRMWRCVQCTLLNSYEYIGCRVCGQVNTGLQAVLSTLSLTPKPRKQSILQQVRSAYYNVHDAFAILPICPVCEAAIRQLDASIVSACQHTLHSSCLRDYLNEQVTSLKLPLHCPVSGCGEELQAAEIEQVLSRSEFRSYLQATLQHYLTTQGDKMKVCPTPDCPFAFEFQGSPHFSCPACCKSYCLRCQTLSHLPATCEEVQRKLTRIERCPQCKGQFAKAADTELCGTCGVEYCLRCGTRAHPGQTCAKSAEHAFVQFATGQGFKVCGKCNVWVEKTMGCNHITCKCGYQFCYVCGKDWLLGECRAHQFT